ncbi:branched-chain amino acid ABC transporter permease [Zoogloea sp.]|uniref:branched-chain amino acid ABC transporter permease n=1 Tax=Zoogloea sp. TaxID=49181 RepID=UPI00261EA7FA|nr:branched-chain amino acid ABC transporter permease [Zoogloea sp.]
MQILINGFISGIAIALLAMAFQMVYLPTRVLFVGLAGLYTLAPYLFQMGASELGGWMGGLLVSLCGVVTLAVLFEWANHAPLTRKRASEGAHLIASLGLYILVVQVVAMIWGNETRTLRTGLDVTYAMGDTILTQSQLLMGGVGLLLLLAVLAMLYLTDIGLRLRALADNPTQFALYGYNVDAHRLLAFALAGVLATAASLLTARDIGFDPHTGLNATLLAIVAVIIGGRTSLIGPIIGGLLLGLIRAQVVWQFSARWQEAVTFLVLALFLLLRPQGLFGRETRIETTVK